MSLSVSRNSGIVACCVGIFFTAAATVVLAQKGTPAANYMHHCVGCHLPDGTGLPPDVPNLGVGFSYLVDSPEGRDFITRVPGVTGAPLPADELAELLNWMVQRFYPAGAEHADFTAEEIQRGKRQPLHDPIKYRTELFPEYEE